jgi:hypothetical protein
MNQFNTRRVVLFELACIDIQRRLVISYFCIIADRLKPKRIASHVTGQRGSLSVQTQGRHPYIQTYSCNRAQAL